MKNIEQKWLYLVVLALIWGSSFILIKKSLLGFTPLQVGGLRIVFASILLFLLGFKSLRTLSGKDWKYIGIAGLCSSFFPPFFFAIAQMQISSGVTSILNSVAPLFTTLVGITLFGLAFKQWQIWGVFVGLLGTVILIVAGMDFNPDQNYWYSFFIIASALGYAFNINIIKKHLAHLSPLSVTTASFGVAFFPALAVLLYTDVLVTFSGNGAMHNAVWYVLILALLGTALANIMFNKLIKLSSPVFAASVTYLIPLVAVLWGWLDGESISIFQLFGGLVILFGVWLVNRKRKV
ncbi:EamA-like transporter family protein [Maribacter sedimenticola]|uniref:EamA-like transporter family protein n=1 Tax=Maribacter sedimenticola TaxID=228956 RepID=A0ABY1SJ16_9FLAO|nr:DMT family transporter [Maribacter sedimenticola]SNR56621.1 EamA-like transporter family protein [Maribacter sedimenticola]